MTVTDSNQGGMLRDAQRLIKSGDFQAAKSVLSEALLSDPDNQDALYFHAVSARYLGETETALRSLRSLIAIANTEASFIDINNRIISSVNERKQRLNDLS